VYLVGTQAWFVGMHPLQERKLYIESQVAAQGKGAIRKLRRASPSLSGVGG
jgi:hypothetical protein